MLSWLLSSLFLVSIAAAITEVVENNDIELIVSDIGWPTTGGQFAIVDALTLISCLIEFLDVYLKVCC